MELIVELICGANLWIEFRGGSLVELIYGANLWIFFVD